MVITVTLNPCIDKTLYLDHLTPGALNMVQQEQVDVSGKGINVGLVLKELQVPVFCTGISFEENHSLLTQRLQQADIPFSFALAPGAIRTNIKLFDRGAGEMTEVNSKGQIVTDKVLAAFFALMPQIVAQGNIVVMSGRIPNGAAETIYRQLVELLGASGVRVIVDAEGRPLAHAAQAAPYLIKPNTFELETTFGCQVDTPAKALQACRQVMRQTGTQVICVSMGEQGALIADSSHSWFAPALPIRPQGFAGAGDSMVAGLCMGLEQNEPLPQCLRYGVAAASASLIRPGTLLAQQQDFADFCQQVGVQQLD